MKKNKFINKKSQVSIYILFYVTLSLFIFSGSLLWVYSYLNFLNREINSIQALNIAESGIEYYRWFLNHFQQDYQDGTGRPGPYTYDFYDRMGNKIGEFSLNIRQVVQGVRTAEIISEGRLINDLNIKKKVKVIVSIPSMAKYSLITDSDIRFGTGTIVYGEIHSNKGIRFDGIANNLIKSSLITYQDPDHTGCKEWAVHTHVNPIDPCPGDNPDPNNLPIRQDVFKAGRKVGVPTVDFGGITSDLSKLKYLSQNGGFYKDFSGDNNFGYEIILGEDYFTLYKVTKLKSISNCQICKPGNICSYSNSRYDLSTWSIDRKSFISTSTYPSNGVIFIEDNLWINGKIKNKRLIIASAKFPEDPNAQTSIVINDDLLYTNYDGTDIIGLIAQKDINIGLLSKDILRIDSVLIAQNGRVGRYYYSSGCGQEYLRQKITVYGGIGTRLRYGFAWVSGNTRVSGYNIRELIYDNNLLYLPPPYFPLSSEFYKTIKWTEF